MTITVTYACVTMVGWVDVPDSDWGDFRRRRAHDYWVYTGSFTYLLMLDNSRAFDTTDRGILLQNLIESDELHALCESSFKREVITSWDYHN